MADTGLNKQYDISNSAWFVILMLLVGGLGWYAYHNRPCAQPVTYYVKSIDPRFGVSTSTIVFLAEQGAGLWNTAAGKPVLKYSPVFVPKAMPISLTYDERQQTAEAGKVVSAAEADGAQSRAKLDAEESQYHADEARYREAKSAFEIEASQYDAQVSAVNQSGGASQEQYQQLNAEKAKLQSDQRSLNEQVRALNADGIALQDNIDAFNSMIRATNSQAAAYNQTAGKDFNEGEYIEDKSGKRIQIYEFSNDVQLMRVLAHELGHAVGLEHNQNPDSIMYPYNTSTAQALTSEDAAAMRAQCKFSLSRLPSLLIPH